MYINDCQGPNCLDETTALINKRKYKTIYSIQELSSLTIHQIKELGKRTDNECSIITVFDKIEATNQNQEEWNHEYEASCNEVSSHHGPYVCSINEINKYLINDLKAYIEETSEYSSKDGEMYINEAHW